MNCSQIQQLIPEWINGELDANIAGQIEKHITGCEFCRAEAGIWRDIGSALKESMQNINAPPGFTAAVMNQLPNRHSTFAASLFSRWKRSIAVAAAFMLVALGSAGAYLHLGDDIIGQVASSGKNVPAQMTDNNNPNSSEPNISTNKPPAKQTVAAAQTGNPQTDPGKVQQTGSNTTKNVNNDGTTTQQGTDKSSDTASSTKPGLTYKPSTKDTESRQYMLLSTDEKRILNSIFLNVKVADLPVAHQQVLAIINNSKATYKILSSESTPAGNQESLKITVSKNMSGSLLDSLKELGQILNCDPQQKDITTSYNEKVKQYQALASQLKNTAPAELEELKVQIATIEAQLNDWDRDADMDTIILWLGN